MTQAPQHPSRLNADPPFQRRTRWLVGSACVKEGSFCATFITAFETSTYPNTPACLCNPSPKESRTAGGASDPKWRLILPASLTRTAPTDAHDATVALLTRAVHDNWSGGCGWYYAGRECAQRFGQVVQRKAPSVCDYSQQAEGGCAAFAEYLGTGELQSSSQCRGQFFGQERRAGDLRDAVTETLHS